MLLREITYNKKKYLPLLLLADEQENMVDRYLNRGSMYVLEDSEVVGECVVTDEGNGILEIKNLAVYPKFQRRGYGRTIIELIAEHYCDRFTTLLVGTGDSPLTIPFYESCGFVRHHTIPNFFTDNYNRPIFEGGKQLTDMVVLQRKLKSVE